MTAAEIELEAATVAQDEARFALASISRKEAAYMFGSGTDYAHSLRKVRKAYNAATERVYKAESKLP